MAEMRVGVIDVGSNTVRLLAAEVDAGSVTALREERTHMGLGEEILRHGRIRDAKLDELTQVVRDYSRVAAKLRVETLETVVTAPGPPGRRTRPPRALARERRPAAASASSRPRRRAGWPTPEPSRAPTSYEGSSRSATSAAARRRSSSACRSSGRPGFARSTSARSGSRSRSSRRPADARRASRRLAR